MKKKSYYIHYSLIDHRGVLKASEGLWIHEVYDELAAVVKAQQSANLRNIEYDRFILNSVSERDTEATEEEIQEVVKKILGYD